MTLAEYFAIHRPQPKYQFGDRVIGKYEGVPFIGTCGGDGMVNETIGPQVTVFLDLPLKTKTTVHYTFIKVKYKDIRKLPALVAHLEEQEPLKLRVAGSNPVQRTKTTKRKKV